MPKWPIFGSHPLSAVYWQWDGSSSPVGSITWDGGAVVHISEFPFSWTGDPANGKEDQERGDLSCMHGPGQGDSRKHEN